MAADENNVENKPQSMLPEPTKNVRNRRCHRIRQLCKRYRTDKHFKENIIYTAIVYLAFFVIGWRKGQFGPSYIDIRMITDADIVQGSWIITAISVGYTSGSIVQGFLYSRVNRKLMLSMSLFLMGAAIVAVPWCVLIELMLLTYFVVGLLQGIIDAGGNVEVLRMWKQNGRLGVLGLNFVFASGSVIAPLVVTPFLKELGEEGHNASLAPSWAAISTHQSHLKGSNITNTTSLDFFSERVPDESNLKIPFSILGGLSLFVALLLAYFYFKYGREMSEDVTVGLSQKPRKLPKNAKVAMLANIAVMHFIHNAIDDTFIALLSSYCVGYFNWTKEEGGYISTTYFLCVLGARFTFIIIERYMNTLVCIAINLSLMLISVTGLLVVSMYMFETGVWIFVSLFGYSTSCVFALMLSWTNEYVTIVTGRISSLMFVSAMIGSASNPLLLGMLTKQFGLIWYCYLFLIELILQLMLFAVGLLGTKYIVKKFGKTFNACN